MHNLKTLDEPFAYQRADRDLNVGTGERVASAVVGGALAAYGLKRGGFGGTAMALLGGGMLLRGTTGHSHVYDVVGLNTSGHRGAGSNRSPYGRSLFAGRIHVTKALTINTPADELYQFWRNFENLPIFMKHLESVVKLDESRSRWKAKAPLGTTVEWDAEVTSEIENERIGWQSLAGSDVANSGVVEFKPTKNRGTEVKINLTYEAPGGKLGEWTAWLFGEEPSLQVADDLRRFKSLMETGLILSIEGQTSGREKLSEKAMTARA